jgi:hypothetical protein
MTQAPEPPFNPLSAAYLKAGEDQLGLYRELFKQFGQFGLQAASGPTGVPAGSMSAPALGLAREHVEIAQKIAELGAQLQRNHTEFLAHLSGIQQEAMRAVQTSGADPNYDAWIESAESAYATLAHGATFARLLAQLCNTWSALKVQRGKMLEYLCRQLDLPTRAEVDSLHQQVRLLRERRDP